MENERGQGVSHAINDSKVPSKVQEAAPVGLEKKLPENAHPTGDVNQPTQVSHALTKENDKTGSVVPHKLQEVLPEKVERVVQNALHDTGDEGGLHCSHN
ncbi:hypothetical protein BP5796_01846 [Coleophoma crateriformis]|uniref:Uncharacterized protein n=1 Tax=Coleophoma crateriformis TaxID=565419 RepID=A0A3D8T1K1_9HELO|nr:hypothetical protein BP5796_01846 [Coleophoma crateriformis]